MACNRRDRISDSYSFLFMLESKFQSDLIKRLKLEFPGCYVLKNDPNYIQGIPDLLVLYKDKWFALECKQSKKAKHRPNQDYYVESMNKMSFAAFVYPENVEEIINEIRQASGA